MGQQVPVDPSARADEHQEGKLHIVAPDLAYQRLAFVNVIFYGAPNAGDHQWVLIDAGIRGMADQIMSAAAERFGEGARPAAIILTHGHFDHVGSLKALVEKWDTTVYAHTLERPSRYGSSSV